MVEEKRSKRDQLLNAAAQIVLEKGAAHLTLDAVAALAGVSKGGLLYHFPSKEALIKGMIDQYLVDFTERVDQVYESLPEARGRWLRAFVIASFEDDYSNPSLLATGFAAIFSDPDLLVSIRAAYEGWITHASDDGVQDALARAVILATDGVFVGKALALPTVNADVRAWLLNLIDRETG